MPLRSERAGVIVILCAVGALSAISHSAYLLRFDDIYARDSGSYITPATSFVRGDGFLNSAAQADTRRTPGYPLVIAVFLWYGADLKYLIVLQHILAASLAVGLAAFTFRMTGRRADAVIA